MPVLSVEGELVNFITESAVAKLLANKIKLGSEPFATWSKQSLRELGAKQCPVVSVSHDDTVFNAFRRIAEAVW